MEKLGIIYIATDTARDNLQYVGQTTNTLKKRKSGGYNRYFQNAIDDHGDQIEWKIVEEVPIEKLDIIETLYIWGLDTMYPSSYNFESGGHENKIMLKETCKKMSEAKTGKKHSEETKRKISEAHTGLYVGKKNPMYRKRHSEESKRKMSKTHTGKKLSSKTKQKMSEATRSEKHPMYGKHLSKETKRKISESSIGLQAGEKHPMAKLTWKKVREIREKYTTGKYTQAILAKEYRVSVPHISNIINNKTWIEKL